MEKTLAGKAQTAFPAGLEIPLTAARFPLSHNRAGTAPAETGSSVGTESNFATGAGCTERVGAELGRSGSADFTAGELFSFTLAGILDGLVRKDFATSTGNNRLDIDVETSGRAPESSIRLAEEGAIEGLDHPDTVRLSP